jgi:hypothetical protein
MAISLVKGRHAAECPCRICEIARETIEASRWQEAPEQPVSFAAQRRQEKLRIPHQHGTE